MQNNEYFRRQLAESYGAGAQVPVTISPFYRNQLGSNVCLSINGVTVYIPANGQTKFVPEVFADLLAQKIVRADAQILRQGALANVIENFEQSPGELKFF